jgi:hypothetical protein
MSDERELTSEQEERVRRLLAEARVDAPMPEDVVTRLDRVLAQLGEAEPAGAHVVELASRRRRKVTTLLAAAAAVVVVGVGLGQVVHQGSDDAGTASGHNAADAEQDAGADSAAPPAAEAAPSGPERQLTSDAVVDGAPVVRATRFAADVARIAESKAAGDVDGEAAQSSPSPRGGVTGGTLVCDPAAWGAGRLQLVRYEGQPAVLAFRPPMGDSQVVDLLQCGTAEILRSVTLSLG